MARLEIHIQEVNKSDEPDWEAMGVVKPKGARSFKYRRCLVDTQDIEYVKEYTKDQSILKCVWMEEGVIVKYNYDDLAIKINDLENSDSE